MWWRAAAAPDPTTQGQAEAIIFGRLRRRMRSIMLRPTLHRMLV